ncbi:MAG TPA: FG-GAP repeat protein [Kineosporiaceae bacterium]|nr:FG-GAP repeat protein [Kineosporiaceae bacterium]
MFPADHRAATVRRSARRFIRALAVSGVLGIACAGAASAEPGGFVVVVGVPDTVPGTRIASGGWLDVQPQGRIRQVLSEDQFGIPGADASGDPRFGAVIALRDLNGDGYSDLVVGAPGKPGPDGREAVGRVDLFFATKTGLSSTGAIALQQPQLTAGDRFGSAIALSARSDNSGILDLWVGAPNHEVAAKRQAGAIFRYAISPTGSPELVGMISQAGSMVPDTPEAGDHFGAVMADASDNRIVVGVPDEDIGNHKDAGMVELLRTDQISNALIKGDAVSQNSKGVAGTPAAGDHFGAALTVGAHAVGIPGEDVGNLKDAGSVQTFGPGTANCQSWLRLCPSKAFTQNSPRIPGKAEAGDRFGAALSEGIYRRESYRCSIYPSVAIGSPGEDLGKAKNAGSVTTFMLPAFATTDDMRGCPPLMFTQGHGLQGTAETGDHVGAALGTALGKQSDDSNQRDRILVGVPGEDVGTIKDAGRVMLGVGPSSSNHAALGGDVAGQRYGSVLASNQAIILNI